MVNELLINLVNNVMGVGKRTARGNQAHHCPFCSHPKPKLEINFTQNKKGLNPWHCWVCDKRGSRISTLFKKIGASEEHFFQLKELLNSQEDYISPSTSKTLSLPKEFVALYPLPNDIIAKHAYVYLKNRKITDEDIIKYNIGYCEYGEYANMIIIPSYDGFGNLNYFTARSFEKKPFRKYKNPEVSRDIIPFELYINWNLPIILCEGMFDAIAIKRNAIPLLGKNIQSNLMKKIVLSQIKKIYIALDSDALTQALEFAEMLMNEGKEVYLVEMDDKDPSEMGFFKFTELIQTTLPLSPYQFLEKKLQLI